MDRASEKGSLFIGIGLVVSVVALIVVVFILIQNSRITDPVALKVGEREVTRVQMDEYKKYGTTERADGQAVTRTVIEYQKNLQLAEKYKIAIPQDYINYTASQTASVGRLVDEATSRNSYIRMTEYNRAFDMRLLEQSQAGYGVLVYEFNATRVTDDVDGTKGLREAGEVASRYRDKIVTQHAPPFAVFEQAKSTSGGLTDSGFYFVTKTADSPTESAEMESARSNAFLARHITGQSVSEVATMGKNKAFFMVTLYKQDKREGVMTKIIEEKKEMKVVDYSEDGR